MNAQTFAISLICGVLLFITCTNTKATLSNEKNVQLIETHFCDFYKDEDCKNQSIADCITREECSTTEDRRHQCFVLWHVDNKTGEQTLRLKGCFADNVGCLSKEKCIDTSVAPKKNLHYCCCEGNMCNKEYSWKPEPIEPEPTEVLPTVSAESSLLCVLLYSVAAVIIILVVIGLSFWIRKTHQSTRYNESPTQALLPSIPPSPSDGLGPIQLIEVKASGRFGSVWKSKCNGEEVAVKIFPVQDQNSWLAEQEVFKLPHMSHPDILHFLGVEKRGDNLQAEFWLVTAYHHRGSLCDYLKAHTVTWLEMGRIAESISTGLTHLHNEIPGKGSYTKPAVAHRDFKSKNVLLKNDMSACIADFGLALIFQPGKPCGDTHGQVGTRRYMAPEVLEGAINFTLDAFLRIDMYACGLVLWELASRCSDQGGEIPEYKLPFELEIGTHPTLEEMQEAVVTKKVRPAILDKWNNHQGLKSMVSTMEECWDHDAEARLSASCVMERVSHLMRYTPQHNEELIVEPNGKVPI